MVYCGIKGETKGISGGFCGVAGIAMFFSKKQTLDPLPHAQKYPRHI